MTPYNFKDGFELATGSETITQEAHVIPATAPYAIDLQGVPQVRADVTTLIENIYLDAATVAEYVTVEIEIDSVWTAFTPTDTSSPAVFTYYCQCQEEANPFSPRLIVNAAYANLNARVSYTSLGAQPLAQWWRWLQRWVGLLDQGRAPMGVSQSAWHGGMFDGRGADNASVWLLDSFVPYSTDAGIQYFEGALWDATDGGDQQVTAFAETLAWKRITVGILWGTDAFDIVTAESAESVSQSALSAPAPLVSGAIPLCYLDVQQDGSADMQALTAVPQTCIFPWTGSSPWHPIRLSHSGMLLVGEFDVPCCPGRAGVVRQVEWYVDDSGASGTTSLNILIDGTTCLTSVATIAANSHAAGRVTATLDGTPTFTATGVLRATFTTVATGGADASLVLWLEFPD